MAFTDLKFDITINIIDNGRNRRSWSYPMTAADHATAVTDAAVILAAFEAVCAGGTVSYSIKNTFANDSLVVPADPEVQAEVSALLLMEDSVNAIKHHHARIPCPELDVFLETDGDGANIVDKAHSDVTDFAALFDTAGELTISDGESIKVAGLISGRRVTRRSSRG